MTDNKTRTNKACVHRLVDCSTISKDSAHHLVGDVFTNVRTLRNKGAIEFNDIPVLLMGFTALLRKTRPFLRFRRSAFTPAASIA